MASVGTVTVNVEVGEDLEAAIRKIVRSELAEIAGAACTEGYSGSPVADTLAALYEEATNI